MYLRLKAIYRELRSHIPFTCFGALTGIVAMLVFRQASKEVDHSLFLLFHPAHVLLSAVVTSSLFKLRQGTQNFLTILLVGYFGSIGVATLSDCVVPFYGETILNVAVPTHEAIHEAMNQVPAESTESSSRLEKVGPDIHLGFIEDWYVVNPAALLGILLAFLIPHEKLHTKLPHAAHVLISTWASSFHVLMNLRSALSVTTLLGIFVVLFIAVWLPCCISDIIFPMLFVGKDKIPMCCHGHVHEVTS